METFFSTFTLLALAHGVPFPGGSSFIAFASDTGIHWLRYHMVDLDNTLS